MTEKKCLFHATKTCSVRKAMEKARMTSQQLNKNILPMGDKEIAKMFMPLIDKMTEVFAQELSVLHYYCHVCPVLKES